MPFANLPRILNSNAVDFTPLLVLYCGGQDGSHIHLDRYPIMTFHISRVTIVVDSQDTMPVNDRVVSFSPESIPFFHVTFRGIFCNKSTTRIADSSAGKLM